MNENQKRNVSTTTGSNALTAAASAAPEFSVRGTDEERETVRELLAWYRGLDRARLAADAQEALCDAEDMLRDAAELRAMDADGEAIGFLIEAFLKLLAVAWSIVNDPEPEDDPMPWAEFEQRHLRPFRNRGRRIRERLRGEAPALVRPRARERRDCRSPRRVGATSRTSSQDPGDDDDGELPSRPCECGGAIYKPARGPWPKRCESCCRAAEAERKRSERAATASRDCAARGCTRQVRGRKRYCSESCRDHEAACRGRDRVELVDARLAGYLDFAEPGEPHSQSFRYDEGEDPGEREALLERAGRGPLLTPQNGAPSRCVDRPSATPAQYAGLLDRFGTIERVEAALRELPHAAHRRRGRDRLRALIAEVIDTAPAWGFAIATNGHHAPELEAVIA